MGNWLIEGFYKKSRVAIIDFVINEKPVAGVTNQMWPPLKYLSLQLRSGLEPQLPAQARL